MLAFSNALWSQIDTYNPSFNFEFQHKLMPHGIDNFMIRPSKTQNDGGPTISLSSSIVSTSQRLLPSFEQAGQKSILLQPKYSRQLEEDRTTAPDVMKTDEALWFHNTASSEVVSPSPTVSRKPYDLSADTQLSSSSFQTYSSEQKTTTVSEARQVGTSEVSNSVVSTSSESETTSTSSTLSSAPAETPVALGSVSASTFDPKAHFKETLTAVPDDAEDCDVDRLLDRGFIMNTQVLTVKNFFAANHDCEFDKGLDGGFFHCVCPFIEETAVNTGSENEPKRFHANHMSKTDYTDLLKSDGISTEKTSKIILSQTPFKYSECFENLTRFLKMVMQDGGVIVSLEQRYFNFKCNSLPEEITFKDQSYKISKEILETPTNIDDVTAIQLIFENDTTSIKVPVIVVSSWPDRNIMKQDDFVALIKYLKEFEIESNKSYIIHCTAGLGRAGTLGVALKLYEMIEQINSDNIVTVLDAVINDFRMSRSSQIVQTADQYAAIYEALRTLSMIDDKTMLTPSLTD